MLAADVICFMIDLFWHMNHVVTSVILDTKFNVFFPGIFVTQGKFMAWLLSTLPYYRAIMLIDWYNCSELWVSMCLLYHCTIVLSFWYFWAKLEIFCHCLGSIFLLDKPFSFYRISQMYWYFCYIKKNTASLPHFVINIVNRLLFSCWEVLDFCLFMEFKCCYKLINLFYNGPCMKYQSWYIAGPSWAGR